MALLMLDENVPFIRRELRNEKLENRLLKGIFEPKADEKYTSKIFKIFIVTPCMLSSYSIITPTTAHI